MCSLLGACDGACVYLQDVINAMNVNPRISFPREVDFVLISSFIREVCRVAFAMQTLDPPLDLAFASDGELYNDTRQALSCTHTHSHTHTLTHSHTHTLTH